MRIPTTIAGLASLLLLAGVTAHAHALLDRADPRVGSTVEVAPHEVSLWFSQNLEPAFSTIEVIDASGHRMDDGKPSIEGNVMRVQLRTIPPGAYRVEWHVLSTDTHTTEGRFTFEVRR